MVLILHDLLADFGLPTIDIPLWTLLHRALQNFAVSSGALGEIHIPQLIYFVLLPFLVMRLSGVPAKEMGLGAGQWSKAWLQTFLLTAIWLAVPIFVLLLLLKFRAISPAFLLGAVLVYSMAFYEEFLFRGVLQTRLRKLMSPTEAIVITSIVFGLYHIARSLGNGNPFVLGIASVITFQALSGVAFGVLFERTGNLVAPTLYHMLVNIVLAALSESFTKSL